MWHIGERMHVTEHDRLWLAVSLFWGLGCENALFNLLTHGGCVVLQESFEAGEALRIVDAERCTLFYGTPNMAQALSEHPDRRGRRESELSGVGDAQRADAIASGTIATSCKVRACWNGRGAVSMGVASLIGQSRPTCEISSGCTVLTGSLRPHDARARVFLMDGKFSRAKRTGLGPLAVTVLPIPLARRAAATACAAVQSTAPRFRRW